MKRQIRFTDKQLADIQAYADALAKQDYYESIGENSKADDLYFDIQTIERQLAQFIVKKLEIKGKI